MFSILCLALLIYAHDTAAELFPPGITKEKAADGWIALFDGETTYGWNVDGICKIDKNFLLIEGEKETTLTTTSAFSAFELVVEYRLEGGKGSFAVKSSDGLVKQREKQSPASNTFEAYKLTVPSCRNSGPISLTVEAGTTMQIKCIVLKPLGTKSIFNGKNLDGWKEIPGKLSKFSVNSNGELNVKNGGGDLQTIDQWDDFVLQLDVISHGNKLNSGIFFRALPGEFWSGYEAQIRNEWNTTVKLKDGSSVTGSVTINGDEVIVKTGRQSKQFKRSEIETLTDLRDKPIDYGSGGIYHYCPARKVVSSDHQWYTMTVIARGNHLAVWVNGYQTAEFTDKRPFNKSARKGRKDDAGVISIQGHDPTTDLSFRNIRVAALPR